ncbi:NAD-dependent epimerase/dehydratase family protein [Sanguibacter sp. 25GB23B1]|uniref:NAD-dependent epimerase/dehydratase family protein n=1 Tax=unclassified Sanguibacter TaxID=2645534 RepID=UPI0032B01054
MTAVPVRSGRTHETRRDDVVVVGDSPVARGIRHRLGAREVDTTDEDLDRFAGAHVVVLVGHGGDFSRMVGREARDRRATVVAEVEKDVVDARLAGVRHVVGISSAMVNGAAPGRPVIEDGEEPVIAVDDGSVGDLLTFESTLEALATGPGEAELSVTILRPAAVVGPDVDTLITRHFEAPRVLTLKGARRDWQFVHVEDVADAVVAVVAHGLTGRITVGALRDGEPDVLSPEDVLRVAGMRAVDLPAVTAFATAERLHRVGVLPLPASDMTFAVYPWTVGAGSLHDAGWRATSSSEECLRILLAQVRGRVGVAGRRVGGRDAAALGAAGAAVALLGTAALWRRARGHA